LESIAVNVSAIEFRNENFLENLFAIICDTGLDPKYLELEVTESVLMKNAELASTILQSLRAKGVRVAIDDFGTGYSSLSYLRKLPLDALKIDQSFVRQIADSPDGATIVTAIISMGRSLHLRVIAEGVETPAELDFLKAQQCDEAQGYRFSRPIPSKQFGALLKAERTHRKAQAKSLLGYGVPNKDFLRPPSFTLEVENRRHFNLENLKLIAREGYSGEVGF
jgi:EAL domain-containing protein (putative c-di-GMP-specific phosphodiesterase class I)